MKTKTTIRVLVACLVLGSLFACDNKKKECMDRCATAAEECRHRRDANCEVRAKECGEACEREFK